MALIVMGALSISTAALIGYARASEHAFDRERQATRAFDIAEAGIHYAFSEIAANDPYDAVAVGGTRGSSASPTTTSIDRGTAAYWATKTAPSRWTVWSVGHSPDGTVSRQISRQLAAATSAQPPWRYGFFIAATSGCTNQSGTSAIMVSVWIGNDFCVSGAAGIREPGAGNTLDIYIGGAFRPSGGASIGTATARVRTAQIRGGCPSAPSGNCAASGSSKVYANTYSSAASTLTKPPDSAATAYASGNWRSPVCSSGSFTFDNDAARNTSLGTIDLFSGGSYSCTVYDATGMKTIGRMAWDALTRRLTVYGVIFVDGSLSSSSSAMYRGSGTIYFNGSVRLSGTLCGPPATVSGSDCSTEWDPVYGKLTIAALSGGWTMEGHGQMDASAYVNGAYTLSGTATVTGPVIADSATVTGRSSALQHFAQPPGPPGVATVWSPVSGSWRQLG